MKQTATLLAAIALLAGCSGEPVTTEANAGFEPQLSADRPVGENVGKELAELRRATASFHDFRKATKAGWSAQITPCMTDPAGAGGMGFHYGNTSLFDGSVRVTKPELLLYEPEKNGRLRLVAVEYIIPYTFHSRSAAPPVLFGQQFQQNDVFQLWGLHAWVWKKNPGGVFANWNPRVNCDNTKAVASMSH